MSYIYDNSSSLLNQKIIFNLLERDLSLLKMKELTGLNDLQLLDVLTNLKNSGYLIEQTDNKDQILCTLLKQVESQKTVVKTLPIIEDSIRFIALSDTHIGSPYENLKALDSIYNYASGKGIYKFLHLGDLLQGIYKEIDQPSKFANIQSQVEHVINCYPYDKLFSNYILLGNHDYHSIKTDGFDISKRIFDERSDFNFLGYHYGFIKIKNDYILLSHYKNYPFNRQKENVFKKYKKEDIEPPVVLCGHFHNSIVDHEKERLVINVPSLFHRYENLLQGAWDIKLKFNCDGKIEEIILKSLVVDSTVIQATKIREKILTR